MEKIKESDWQAVEGIRRSALQRLCRLALEETQAIASDSSRTWHQRFQDACAVLDGCEPHVRLLVGDLHQTNACVRLAAMKAAELISPDEYSGLSAETRSEIENLIEILYTPRADTETVPRT